MGAYNANSGGINAKKTNRNVEYGNQVIISDLWN